MINQEINAQGRKYQLLLNFWIRCKELGDSKLRVFEHACAVSAIPVKSWFCHTVIDIAPAGTNLTSVNDQCHFSSAPLLL